MQRYLSIAWICSLAVFLSFGQNSSADIYEWEYINPANPALGKQQSTTLVPDGADLFVQQNSYWEFLDLSKAYLQGANLSSSSINRVNLSASILANANFNNSDISNTDLTSSDLTGANISKISFSSVTGLTALQFYSTGNYQSKNLSDISFTLQDLTSWSFAGQNLRNAEFSFVNMSNVVLAGADIRGAYIYAATGLTAPQVYSTATYQARDFAGVTLSNINLSNWNFSNFNLTNASFGDSVLLNTSFVGADIRGAYFYDTTEHGFSAGQLYSTASYKNHDLTGISLFGNELSGWDFSNQNLTNANFAWSHLIDTNFSGATIRGAVFSSSGPFGLTKEQLYSTASYQNQDLVEIDFRLKDLSGWNFTGQNLANAAFNNAVLTSTDFRGADLRGAVGTNLSGAIVTNLIRPDGTIRGLNLSAGEELWIHDNDGVFREFFGQLPPIAITVEDSFAADTTSALVFSFEADEWNSTISFEAGIPVSLDGTLELGFSDDVNATSQIGRTLDLFDWTGVSPTGLFTVASDYEWDLTNLYTTGEVTLLSVLALPGDFDGDGDVDGRDFLTWQRDPNVGSLAAWQANYGDSLGSLSAFVAVPEPAGVVLAAFMLMGSVVRGPLRSAGAPRRG